MAKQASGPCWSDFSERRRRSSSSSPEAPVACVSHALAFVKSFWPEAQLETFAQGVAAECTEEQFNE
jgi:hypothetical protein